MKRTSAHYLWLNIININSHRIKIRFHKFYAFKEIGEKNNWLQINKNEINKLEIIKNDTSQINDFSKSDSENGVRLNASKNLLQKSDIIITSQSSAALPTYFLEMASSFHPLSFVRWLGKIYSFSTKKNN